VIVEGASAARGSDLTNYKYRMKLQGNGIELEWNGLEWN
jgi:hypothetical protein